MTQSPVEKNGMNEHPSELDEYIERSPRARRVGIETLEKELHGEKTDAVDISIYVNGRMMATTTDEATVRRIMAILTGLEQ